MENTNTVPNVDTTYLDVIACADTREELLEFDAFMGDMLITGRSCSAESYAQHGIWESSVVDEWNITFEAKVTNESYGKLIAYAAAHGIGVYGNVTVEGWSGWQIIVERPEADMAAAN